MATIYNKNKKFSFQQKDFLSILFILFNIHNDRSFIICRNIQSTILCTINHIFIRNLCVIWMENNKIVTLSTYDTGITMFYACCFRSPKKMRYVLRRWNICTQLEKILLWKRIVLELNTACYSDKTVRIYESCWRRVCFILWERFQTIELRGTVIYFVLFNTREVWFCKKELDNQREKMILFSIVKTLWSCTWCFANCINNNKVNTSNMMMESKSFNDIVKNVDFVSFFYAFNIVTWFAAADSSEKKDQVFPSEMHFKYKVETTSKNNGFRSYRKFFDLVNCAIEASTKRRMCRSKENFLFRTNF